MQQLKETRKRTETEAFEIIKKCLGLPKDSREHQKLQKVELVLQDVQTIQPFLKFKSLKSLALVNCGIESVKDIGFLASLQQLWLNENQIAQISPIAQLKNLRRLYLSFNPVRQVDQLCNLQSLEVVWLVGNRIREFPFLQLSKLKQINLADNLINFIPEVESLRSLTYLNISKNLISSFADIKRLQKLSVLSSVSFSDKMFGQCPVSRLTHYKIFVLNCLKGLTSLDGETVQTDFKSKAQNTFFKKKMYYTMKIKTIQKFQSFLLKVVERASLAKLENLHLVKTAYFIQHLHKQTALPVQFHKISDLFQKFTKLSEEMRIRVKSICSLLINRQSFELQSGGNWRLQLCNRQSKWFPQILEVLKEHGDDMPPYNIRRVYKIHNNFTKFRMDQEIQSIQSLRPDFQPDPKILFFGVDPAALDSLQEVVYHGLPFRKHSAVAKGIKTAILPHMTSLKKRLVQLNGDWAFGKQVKQLKIGSVTKILICRAELGKFQADSKHTFFKGEESHSSQVSQQPPQYGENDSIFRVDPDDTSRKIFLLKNNKLLTAEYMVEIELKASDFQQKLMQVGGYIVRLQQSISVDKQFPKAIERIHNHCFEAVQQAVRPTIVMRAQQFQQVQVQFLKADIVKFITFSLERQTQVPVNQPMQTDSFINFSQEPLFNHEELAFSKVTTLVLQNCKIKKIHQLPLQVVHLNLANNLIKQTEWLLGPSIKHLDISSNEIQESQELIRLSRMQLKQLIVLFNPLLMSKHWDNRILCQFSGIERFNHCPVPKVAEQFFVNQISQELIMKPDVIGLPHGLQLAPYWHSQVLKLNLSNMRILKMANLQLFVGLKSLKLSSNLISKIQCLENCTGIQDLALDNNNLSRIQHLDHLPRLTHLQLSGNYISRVEGLPKNLIQLCLSNNSVSSLQKFPYLQKLLDLYLSNNQLSTQKEVQNLKDLPQLIILDTSHNPFCAADQFSRQYILFMLPKVIVLDGLQVEKTERELANDVFMGRLADEIMMDRLGERLPHQIRQLDLSDCKLMSTQQPFWNQKFTNLQILNLSFNFYTSMKMLQHVPKLKILNFRKNRVDALLTQEEKDQRRGLIATPNLQILDLGFNSITELNGVQYCSLHKLRLLKLENNSLSRLDHLQDLPSLIQLNVNFNSIKNFESTNFSGSKITRLYISDNIVKNIVNLQQMLNLTDLSLARNRIVSLDEFDKLTSLTLRYLDLSGNRIATKAGYRLMILKKFPLLQRLDQAQISADQRRESQLYLKNLGYNGTVGGRPQVIRLNSVVFEGAFNGRRRE